MCVLCMYILVPCVSVCGVYLCVCGVCVSECVHVYMSLYVWCEGVCVHVYVCTENKRVC